MSPAGIIGGKGLYVRVVGIGSSFAGRKYEKNSNDILFFVFSPPLKTLPMNRCRPSRLVHPLRGCGDTRGNALYRDASPNGDKGCNNQHLGARHVSATTPPRWENDGHTDFTATPPQCDGATTTLHSQFSILNSSFSHTFSAKERDTETALIPLQRLQRL